MAFAGLKVGFGCTFVTYGFLASGLTGAGGALCVWVGVGVGLADGFLVGLAEALALAETEGSTDAEADGDGPAALLSLEHEVIDTAKAIPSAPTKNFLLALKDIFDIDLPFSICSYDESLLDSTS